MCRQAAVEPVAITAAASATKSAIHTTKKVFGNVILGLFSWIFISFLLSLSCLSLSRLVNLNLPMITIVRIFMDREHHSAASSIIIVHPLSCFIIYFVFIISVKSFVSVPWFLNKAIIISNEKLGQERELFMWFIVISVFVLPF